MTNGSLPSAGRAVDDRAHAYKPCPVASSETDDQPPGRRRRCGSTSSLPRTGPMQSLAGAIDGRLLLPYGDLFSRRALLQKRLHGDDAAGANGPDPRHRNVEVPFPEPARADEPPEH